jgi:hypothetical protein
MEYISRQCSISAQQLHQEIFCPEQSPSGLKVRLCLAFLIACSPSSPIGPHLEVMNTAALIGAGAVVLGSILVAPPIDELSP